MPHQPVEDDPAPVDATTLAPLGWIRATLDWLRSLIDRALKNKDGEFYRLIILLLVVAVLGLGTYWVIHSPGILWV